MLYVLSQNELQKFEQDIAVGDRWIGHSTSKIMESFDVQSDMSHCVSRIPDRRQYRPLWTVVANYCPHNNKQIALAKITIAFFILIQHSIKLRAKELPGCTC